MEQSSFLEQASNLEGGETTRSVSEIAMKMIEEAYFDFESLNTKQFLARVREIYSLAQLKETHAKLAIAGLMSTRVRVRREAISAAAEKELMEAQMQKMGENEMNLRATISAYEEQFQELNDFKVKYLALQERVDAQASRTLDESAPKVEQLSQELSATREASMTSRKECEDAEIRLVQAGKEVQRLTEQKSKHELELEQLRKQIEASQQAGRNAYATGTQGR